MDENEKDQLTHTGCDTLLIVKALESTDFTFLDLGLKNSFLFLFLFWVVVGGQLVFMYRDKMDNKLGGKKIEFDPKAHGAQLTSFSFFFYGKSLVIYWLMFILINFMGNLNN